MAESDPLPFPIPEDVDPFVGSLVNLVGGMQNLDAAVQNALSTGVVQMTEWGIETGLEFLQYATGQLRWIPSETTSGTEIYNTLCLFYYILDQPPINRCQTPINPSSIDQPLSPVSQWVVTYAVKIGNWMDTPASLTPTSLQTYYDSPNFNMEEALVPPGGFKTFNQLFSRRLKPNQRPITSPTDDSIITWPADSTFDGNWPIESTNTVTIKTVDWPITELLQGSAYAQDFAGGIWMHAFLGPTDYHRQHAPVSGNVLEAKVIQGQAYLEVDIAPDHNGKKTLVPHRSWRSPKNTTPSAGNEPQKGLVGALDAPDTEGYQFLQTRGCIIIENEVVGKVAVLPIGMAYVSSVVLSVQDIYQTGAVGTPSYVNKGDEISCFQFGGSDIVVVFQAGKGVDVSGLELHKHYSVGEVLGRVGGGSREAP